MTLRQTGSVASGENVPLHALSTRQACSLQFFPDGHDWADGEPVLLSTTGPGQVRTALAACCYWRLAGAGQVL